MLSGRLLRRDPKHNGPESADGIKGFAVGAMISDEAASSQLAASDGVWRLGSEAPGTGLQRENVWLSRIRTRTCTPLSSAGL